MTEPAMSYVSPPWNMDELQYADIDKSRVRNNEPLFFVLASASLVESGSDLYTHVLLNYFDGGEVGDWLRNQWEPEELQHGRALRRYVESVWPEFDWSSTYENFLTEYSRYCVVDALEEIPALELLARSVIETGTATLYRALRDYTDEPVLKQLTALIQADEVRHYKYFCRYFNQFSADSHHGRWPVYRAVVRRLAELRNEDADCALRHVFHCKYPNVTIDSAAFAKISADARALVVNSINPPMLVKMILHPLQLPVRVQKIIQRPCVGLIRQFMRA
jgi:hypothetical protein